MFEGAFRGPAIFPGFWNARTPTNVANASAVDPCGAACDNACAEAAGLCIEPGGYSTGERWLFVGDGRGAYAPVQTYNYVGKGLGNYDMTNATFRRGCYTLPCLLSSLLMCLCIPLLGSIFYALTEAYSTHHSYEVRPAKPPFDCSLPSAVHDATSFDAEWVETDRDKDGSISGHELANTANHGQLSQGAVEALFRADGDGSGELSRGEFVAALRGVVGAAASGDNATNAAVRMWTPSKRSWCCEHGGVAAACIIPHLPVVTTTTTVVHTLPYDCYAGYGGWKQTWSRAKREWCCRHFDRGCWRPPPTTTHKPCKGWCCELVGRSCPTTTQPYDCQVGLTHYRRGWSHTKRQWCCQRLPHVACADIAEQV